MFKNNKIKKESVFSEHFKMYANFPKKKKYFKYILDSRKSQKNWNVNRERKNNNNIVSLWHKNGSNGCTIVEY